MGWLRVLPHTQAHLTWHTYGRAYLSEESSLAVLFTTAIVFHNLYLRAISHCSIRNALGANW